MTAKSKQILIQTFNWFFLQNIVYSVTTIHLAYFDCQFMTSPFICNHKTISRVIACPIPHLSKENFKREPIPKLIFKIFDESQICFTTIIDKDLVSKHCDPKLFETPFLICLACHTQKFQYKASC